MSNEVSERTAPPQVARPPSLIGKLAQRFHVEPGKLATTLKSTCFKTERPVSDEQLLMLLVVADQYNLNPFTRELFAFVDEKRGGGIVPVVSVDGWSRIVNEHPQFDGVQFEWDDNGAWCEAIIYRKDRNHPIRVREYLAECKRATSPWTQWPRRMLRHKAFIQCARIAFGFAGIFDEDEAQRIINLGDAPEVEAPAQQQRATKLRETIAGPLTPPPPYKPPEVTEPAAIGPNEDAPPIGRDENVPLFPFPESADSLIAGVNAATHVEAAQLAVDRARDLPEEERKRVEAAFRTKWEPLFPRGPGK